MKASPRTLKRAGIWLLVTAGLLAFAWYVWLAPWRRLHSFSWYSLHTENAVWIETQKQLHRFGVDHDSSIRVGHNGDKKWMEWVVRTLKPVREPGDCGEGQMHLPDAPMYITNQRVDQDADWASWWSTNRNKSQEEWIREGFSKRGVELESPLSTNNVITLLKLIATSRENHVTYNARRWLRDADQFPINPQKFDFTNVTPEDHDKVLKGLIDYAQWLGQHENDPGRLYVTEFSFRPAWAEEDDPMIEQSPYRWLLKIFLLTMAGGGVLLLRRSSQMVSIKHALP